MITLNLLALAIGLGLLFTVLITEAFGLAAGGLVVPGYVALKLMEPINLFLTIVVALFTFALVRILSSFMVLYGRRMTALTILTAYLLGALLELVIGGGVTFDAAFMNAGVVPDTASDDLLNLENAMFVELGVIGYIVPGLIALWFNRQGILATLSGLMITSVLVRLALIFFVPEALMDYERETASFRDLISQILAQK